MSSLQDEFVLSCLEELRPMLINLARRTGMEIDDIMQEAAIIIMQEVQAQAMPPIALLNVIIRRRIYAFTRRRRSLPIILSIDMPYSREGVTTLADMLPDTPPDSEAIHKQEQRITSLYQALHRLPLDEQREMRSHYALNCFQVRRSRSKRVMPQRTWMDLRRSALRSLRHDMKLRRALAL